MALVDNGFEINQRAANVEGRVGDAVVVAKIAGGLQDASGTTLTVKNAFVDAVTAGHTQVVAAVPGKKIRVLYYLVSLDVATTWYFTSASTAKTSRKTASAAADAPNGGFLFETVAGEALRINLAAAVNAGVDVVYVEV